MFVSEGTVHQFLVSSAVLLNELTIGLGWGWVAPVLAKLQNDECGFQLTEEETSWLASISEIGRVTGPLLAALLVDRIGRQKSIIFVSISYVVIWIPLIFTHNIWVILAMRCLFGAINGVNDVCSSIYLAENLSPSFRGIAGAIVSVFYYAGMFVEFTLGTYLSYVNLAIVNAAVSVCGLAGCFFVVETPYFDVMKGRYDKAEKNLVWIRGGAIKKENVAGELDKIKQSVLNEKLKKFSFGVIFASSENLRSVLMVLGVYFLTSCTGFAAITFYSSLIFVESTLFSPTEFTMLFGVAQFLAVCVSPMILERFGRRTLIIATFIVSTLCHGVTSVLLTLNNAGYVVPFYPYLVFVSVTTCSAIFAFIYPVVYILRGEVFPLSIKAVGGSLAILVQSATSFFITKIFLVLDLHHGMQTNFFLYLAMSLVTVFYTYFFIPETRGKTLIDIQSSMKGSSRKKTVEDQVEPS